VNLGLLDEQVVRHTRKARGNAELGQVYERTRRNQDVWMPELTVVGAWVVVMKLAYGLNESDR
jgi:hypothetical protein